MGTSLPLVLWEVAPSPTHPFSLEHQLTNRRTGNGAPRGRRQCWEPGPSACSPPQGRAPLHRKGLLSVGVVALPVPHRREPPESGLCAEYRQARCLEVGEVRSGLRKPVPQLGVLLRGRPGQAVTMGALRAAALRLRLRQGGSRGGRIHMVQSPAQPEGSVTERCPVRW